MVYFTQQWHGRDEVWIWVFGTPGAMMPLCVPHPVLSVYIQSWTMEHDILYKVICASEEKKKIIEHLT